MNKVYALLLGVGDYEKMNIVNLPTYKNDVAMLGSAIVSGLNVPRDNIRLMVGENNNGYIETKDLAKAISSFKNLLNCNDTFIFYFSGHGRDRNMILSNGQIELQSVIDFIENLPSKNKIVILDCCYSGKFVTAGARELQFEDSLNDFVGHGIAVMASSAADEVARLGPNGGCSAYTGALSTAIIANKKVRKGKLSLEDINDETQHLIRAWNNQNPDKAQHPIFRTSMGGTIFFTVKEDDSYKQMEICKETDAYVIKEVKPLSSGVDKRLSAFIIPKYDLTLDELARITIEIAETIKYAEVYVSEESEKKFEGYPARAVWCYFGNDNTDIINHLYFAYTIWAADDEMRVKFFRDNRHSRIHKGIYMYENTSYDVLKKMQESTMSREEFVRRNQELLSEIVSLAEQFIVDMQEVANQTVTIDKIKEVYQNWITSVKKKYISLSDGDIAPDDLHMWSEGIMQLAGYIVDFAILLDSETITDRELWLINNAKKQYYEYLEKLKEVEKKTRF